MRRMCWCALVWLADRLGQRRLVSVSRIVAALGTAVVMTTI
jgi:nitrate/nitrite transporter NarK